MTITVRVGMMQAQAELKRLQAQMAALEAQTNRAAGRMAGFGRGMAGATRHMERFGKNMQWVGRQIEYNFTLPMALAVGFSAKWALENEKQFTRLRKVYNESQNDVYSLSQELEYLGRGFRALSDIMGVHQDEVIQIGAMWAQAGATGVGLLRSTKNTLELMVLGEMEAVEATEALIAVQAQWGLSSKELTQQIAYLNAIENETSVSMQGLIQSLARSGGVAREAGMSIRELAAMTAALVPAAGTATQAGNGLRTMITRIMSPTGAAVEELQSLGIAVDTVAWQSQTFTERIFAITESLDGMGQQARSNALVELGSRWQVNRLSVLMRDLRESLDSATEGASNYATAMEATADAQAAMDLYNRELLIFLGSQPQQFKILSAQMRNLATQIIQPLLPALLALMAQIRDWIRAFAALPPETQKNVIMIALLVAVLGPVIRYMGATILLLSQLSFFFGLLWQAMKPVFWAFGLVLKGFKALFMFMTGDVVLGALSAIRGAFLAAWTSIVTLTAGFRAAMMAQMSALWTGMVAGARIAFTAIGTAFTTAFRWLIGLLHTAGLALLRGMGVVMTGLISIVSRSLTFLLWRVVVPGILAIITAITSPFWIAVAALTIIIAAIVVAVWKFPEETARAVKVVGEALSHVPRLFVAMGKALRNIFIGIIRMVVEFFSYLNPFTRHSPSLVDNVTRGVDRIAAEFSRLRHIGRYFRSAIDALNEFREVTADTARRFKMEEFAELRGQVTAAQPSAAGAFDRMVAEIWRLKGALVILNQEIQQQAIVVNRWADHLAKAEEKVRLLSSGLDVMRMQASDLQTAISEAQSTIDNLASTPIEGMRAYSDALFENEMQQKRVRLAILEMEKAQKDSGKTTDQLRDRMAALSGEIEMLGGQRETLRQAGAGSDILGAYDEQIKAMETERRKLMDAATSQQGPDAELALLQAQLEDLRIEAEMTNLREALEFDPMRREIDLLVNAMDEMSFDDIVAGIQEQQRVIEDLQPELDALNAKIKEQEKALRDAEKARDEIQTRYEAELATLNALEFAYDTLEQQISDMEAAMRDFASSFEESAGRISDAAGAAGDAMAGIGGDFPIQGGTAGIGEETGDLLAEVEALEQSLSDAFGDFDFLAPFRKMWAKAKERIGEFWDKFTGAMVGGASGAVELAWGAILTGMDNLKGAWSRKIEETVGEAKEAWGEFSGFWSGLWSDIKTGASLYWSDFTGWIGEEWSLFDQGFREIFGPWGNWFSGVWGDMKKGAEGYWSDFTGYIGPEWDQFKKGAEKIWGGVKETVVTAWRNMNSDSNRTWDDFRTKIDPKIEAFRTFMDGKWRDIKKNAEGNWNEIVSKVSEKAGAMKKTIDENLQAVKDFWGPRLEGLRTTAVHKWQDIKQAISDKSRTAKDNANQNIQAVHDFWAPKMDAIKNKVSSVWGSIGTTISNIAGSVTRSVRGMINGVIDGINSLIRKWNAIEFRLPTIKVGRHVLFQGGTFGVIDIPLLSNIGGGGGAGIGGINATPMATGAVVTSPTLALIGETAKARPEIVTPEGLMRTVFRQELKQMGGAGGGRAVHFYGDLSFPNVKDGTDAEAFVRNLEAMVD